MAALTIGLCWAYLLQSRADPANSDASGMVLEGWDMLHGNLLLSGWSLADVSFYTFEVPVDGLISVVYGLRTDVVHVAAAAEYALLVLFAALVAAGSSRDRARGGYEAWIRGLIAALILVAPGTNPGAHILLLGPDHTAIGVPVLAALLAVDRLRPRRLLPVLGTAALVCLLLIWAQLDDPVAEFSCALPLALACLAPLLAVPVRRTFAFIRARRGRPTEPRLTWRREAAVHGYDVALFVAAVASFGLTQLAIRAIRNAGGYYVMAIPAKSQISQWSTVPTQIRVLGQNLLYLFGANWWGRTQPQEAYGYVHLVGVVVAAIGLLIAILSWPRADRVTRTLVLALLAVFAAGSMSPLTQPISGAHEIAIMLSLSAALAGRSIGPWLARRPAAGRVGPAAGRVGPALRGAVACVLVVAGIGYLSNLAFNAAQRAPQAINQDLADWLVAHNLTSGMSGYWDANITALDSGGKVRLAPLVRGSSYGYLWETKAAWYNPDVSYANFIIAHEQRLGAGYVYVGSAVNWYGQPNKMYLLGRTVVMVYDRNLLSQVIQPTPGYLYGPPGG